MPGHHILLYEFRWHVVQILDLNRELFGGCAPQQNVAALDIHILALRVVVNSVKEAIFLLLHHLCDFLAEI